ncbi:MAG: cation:proton antiporter [Spirochaetota bacterium]|nr:cation:proton antiporter [Spirochaetota bacterium]
MTHLMTMLVLQLAIIIISARIIGWVFHKYLKQPKVLGELAAGMIIGPYALGSINIAALHGSLFHLPETTLPISPELYGFAVIASIILLFSAGLETDLPTFLRFSAKGSLVGFGGVVLSFFLGDMVTVLFFEDVVSFMDPKALFLGTLSTATSVGITARILSERRKMSTPEGVTILAAAVLDDVIGIILLAVVVGVAKVKISGSGVAWGEIGLIALKAFGFWLISTVIGIIIAPKITKRLKMFESMEMIAVVSFGLALFLSGLSEMAGLAMIIGAYVMGLSLSQTDISHEIRESLHGVYSFFVPIFFAIMGMMVNFSAMKGVLVFGVFYTVVAFAGKIIGCGVPALLTGFNIKGALRIGAGMLPRGEVTLIVAGIGLSSGVIGQDMFGVAIMTLLAASIIAPPYLIKTFEGGSGYRSKLKDKDMGDIHTIELDFPGQKMADFIRVKLLDGFRGEEFFVHKIDPNKRIYHIRKDEILITLIQNEDKISINTLPENEAFVRLLMLEEVLDLKDFLSGLESMKSPDMMGADLLMGMFGVIPEKEPEKE